MIFHSAIVFTTAITLLLPALLTHAASIATSKTPQGGRSRVDFTLGVMSRCPDALFTESYLDKVIERTNDKINLQVVYIGEIDAEQEYGVRCKHGDQECAGNVHQLCISHLLRPSRSGPDFDLSPSAAQRKRWDFIQCENYDGIPRIGSLALAQQCTATIKGPRWEQDGVKDCIEGSKGKRLLQESVRESKRRGIEKSATVQIEGKTVCVRDDGAWKECEGGHDVGDFVKAIEKAFNDKNSL